MFERQWVSHPVRACCDKQMRAAIPTVFSYDRFQRFFVQAGIGHQLLQTTVLLFPCPTSGRASPTSILPYSLFQPYCVASVPFQTRNALEVGDHPTTL